MEANGEFLWLIKMEWNICMYDSFNSVVTDPYK